MTLTEILRDFWALVVGLLSAVIWFVRVEALSRSNREEIKKIWARIAEDREAANESRKETHARIGDVHGEVREMGRDIKEILQRLPRQ